MKKYFLILLCLSALCAVSCNEKQDPDTRQEELYYTNFFACGMMNTYYLWRDEILDEIKNWEVDADPVEKVSQIRYKDRNGNDIDRWSTMLPEYSSTISSLSGESTGYGYDMIFYQYGNTKNLCAVVTFAYADTPASEAGLKRGDVIVEINGQTITVQNYQDLYYSDFTGGSRCTLKLHDGRTVKMQSREIHENPVLCHRVLSDGRKSVGYLAYTSFTVDSCQELIDVCKEFKDAGIKELVLDLRYNSGGLVMTEQLLGSMLAPQYAVDQKLVYEQDVYNSYLLEAYGDDVIARFTTDFSLDYYGKPYSFSTAGANIGLEKLYVLVSGSTASASESLVTCLSPYMEVELIGKQTHGKYCGGIIKSAADWYEFYREELTEQEIDVDEALSCIGDWGIYVMVSRYADKNGLTPCMPDGFVPDIEVEDCPEDGVPLGNADELLLSVALQRAGFSRSTMQEAAPRRGEPLQRLETQPERQPLRVLL